MDPNAPQSIPYITHEAAMARTERTQRRLWITVWLLIVLLVATNFGWIAYEAQFEEVTSQSYEADADGGGNAIINDSGSVNINGESEEN